MARIAVRQRALRRCGKSMTKRDKNAYSNGKKRSRRQRRMTHLYTVELAMRRLLTISFHSMGWLSLVYNGHIGDWQLDEFADTGIEWSVSLNVWVFDLFIGFGQEYQMAAMSDE